MIKKLFPALYADKNILYFNEDSCDSVFDCNGIGILNRDLNNINLIINLMKMFLTPLFVSDFWLGILHLKNVRHLKKSQVKN